MIPLREQGGNLASQLEKRNIVGTLLRITNNPAVLYVRVVDGKFTSLLGSLLDHYERIIVTPLSQVEKLTDCVEDGELGFWALAGGKIIWVLCTVDNFYEVVE